MISGDVIIAMINCHRKNDRSLQNTHTHETYNYKNSSYEKVSNSTKNETKTNKRNIISKTKRG